MLTMIDLARRKAIEHALTAKTNDVPQTRTSRRVDFRRHTVWLLEHVSWSFQGAVMRTIANELAAIIVLDKRRVDEAKPARWRALLALEVNAALFDTSMASPLMPATMDRNDGRGSVAKRAELRCCFGHVFSTSDWGFTRAGFILSERV